MTLPHFILTRRSLTGNNASIGTFSPCSWAGDGHFLSQFCFGKYPAASAAAKEKSGDAAGGKMRLDKFLKVSRIIKRRTVANEACDTEHVTVNGRKAKASYDVKVGDTVEITFGERTLRFVVREVLEHVAKDEASSMYEILP